MFLVFLRNIKSCNVFLFFFLFFFLHILVFFLLRNVNNFFLKKLGHMQFNIYIYMCVCVCVCVCKNDFLLF